MKRAWIAVLAVLVLAGTAPAHFIWIVPGQGTAQVVFSDSLAPDENVPITRISATELFLQGLDGESALKWKKGTNALEVEVPGRGPRVVAGTCKYGVLEKGGSSFLLIYQPKAVIDQRGRQPEFLFAGNKKLDLEIVLVPNQADTLQVLWQAKPLEGAEVMILVPGAEKTAKAKTDAQGRFTLPASKKEGAYGVMVGHTVTKEGAEGGKKYAAVKYYATLVLPRAAAEGGVREVALRQVRPVEPAADKADPEATKLLADARAARACWANFPGFAADLEVNCDGQVSRGRVQVSDKGKVEVTMEDDKARQWAQGQLRSIVMHRVDNSASLDTPCAFSDAVANHPMGRAIKVLNDELHSSYRVRDRQIIEVNRQMKDSRFTITVLENTLNPEGKYLPAHYVVNTWDLKTGGLRSSQTHRQTFRRAGGLDLPETACVVTAEAGKLETRCLRLSNVKLP